MQPLGRVHTWPAVPRLGARDPDHSVRPRALLAAAQLNSCGRSQVHKTSVQVSRQKMAKSTPVAEAGLRAGTLAPWSLAGPPLAEAGGDRGSPVP